MEQQQGHTTMTGEMQHSVQSSLDCSRTCLETVRHCLEMGGKHAEAGHITTMLDCAEICQTNANFLLRGSQSYLSFAQLCADVCDQCAVSCEQFGDDAQMRACAEACRRCASSCRQLTRAQRRAA